MTTSCQFNSTRAGLAHFIASPFLPEPLTLSNLLLTYILLEDFLDYLIQGRLLLDDRFD